MKLTKQPILKYSQEHVPVSTGEIEEVNRMIAQHREAAKARKERGEKGVEWEGRTISDHDIAQKLTDFRDHQLAMRN